MDKRVAEATDDYLRLRHKAKEAHATSAEEQRQSNEAREKVHAMLHRAMPCPCHAMPQID